MAIDFEAIKACLTNESGYSSAEANLVVGDLQNLHEELKPLLCAWIEKREIPNIERHGYSYQGLIEKYQMNPIASILTLDWIIREPEAALPLIGQGIK